MGYITIDSVNIDKEHICCAFSDKKCRDSYELKKSWMKNEFSNGLVFRRIDERAKVFIEYGPAESAWVPFTAPNYFNIGCFWVSGKYKGKGHGKALLQETVNEAKEQGKDGLVCVTGEKKFHFMTDGKWLINQGFKICDTSSDGFALLYLPLNERSAVPVFNLEAKTGLCSETNEWVVYYSNRCPYSEYHVHESLKITAEKRKLDFGIIKIDTLEMAKSAPTPATIFSLFHNGKFVTTDISVCLDSRFDKIVSKHI